MRHKCSGKSLGRTSSQRKLLMRNLTVSLIQHENIVTTLPKAKELRRFIEPLMTRSKVNTLANRRLVFDRLRNKQAVDKLFKIVAPAIKNRAGGYLRILKCGFRMGDNAPKAFISIIDMQKKDVQQLQQSSAITDKLINNNSNEIKKSAKLINSSDESNTSISDTENIINK